MCFTPINYSDISINEINIISDIKPIVKQIKGNIKLPSEKNTLPEQIEKRNDIIEHDKVVVKNLIYQNIKHTVLIPHNTPI